MTPRADINESVDVEQITHEYQFVPVLLTLFIFGLLMLGTQAQPLVFRWVGKD